ncbi:MAG: ice-binding family protein [Gaiellaceae bacterium]
MVALGATVLVSGSAQAVTPPTVLLGTAGQFAVLAGSGITNTGASTISGDVGSSPTSTETGFAACPGANCVTLTGANHTDPNPNDATTQGAKAALTTAYDDAAGRSPTTVLTELGGQTLVAGVYSSASGTFGMTGTLVLDGENNADAVFIFQTASTLITGGTGNITLTRSAQACNIFWKVGSAATLGAGSTFRGTILAHDDISLGNGVTVDGRVLAGEQASGAGAVTLIGDTITKPSTCVSQADVDAAIAAAAQAAAAQAAAAQAAATAQHAADQAAAAMVAAAKAAEAANVEAARVAAAKAAEAAKAAADQAEAAKAAAAKAATAAKAAAAKAAKAANVEAARAAARKAAAAAKFAAAKAKAAKVAAAKAKAAAKAAADKIAEAKRKAASSSKHGYARPPLRHVGLTG